MNLQLLYLTEKNALDVVHPSFYSLKKFRHGASGLDLTDSQLQLPAKGRLWGQMKY